MDEESTYEDKCRKRGLRRSEKERIQASILAEFDAYAKRRLSKSRRFAPMGSEERHAAYMLHLYRKDEGKYYNRHSCPSGPGCEWCIENKTCASRKRLAGGDDELSFYEGGEWGLWDN